MCMKCTDDLIVLRSEHSILIHTIVFNQYFRSNNPKVMHEFSSRSWCLKDCVTLKAFISSYALATYSFLSFLFFLALCRFNTPF